MLVSINFDEETARIAEKLARLSNLSVPDMIKAMIKRKGRTSELEISKSVKKISGIIKTDKDYKALREMITDERIEKYEGRIRCQSRKKPSQELWERSKSLGGLPNTTVRGGIP